MAIRIPLRNRDGEVVAHTAIDDEDAYVTAHAWYRSHHGYAVRTVGQGNAKRLEYLHRVITRAAPGTEVDHLNRDPLDNRRANLRVTNKSGNMQNRGPWRSRDLPRNVYQRDSKYAVVFTLVVDGKRTTRQIGRFITVEEADAAAKAWRATHQPMSFEAALAVSS